MAEKKPNFIKKIKIDDEPSLHISVVISYPLLLLILSIPYLIWEIYWATKVGYPVIKWHTHLMVYFYLWLAGYMLLYYTVHGRKDTFYSKSLTVFTAVLISLFLAEALLLTLHIGQTTSEGAGDTYSSVYDASHETWYHLWSDKSHWIKKGEYKYIRYTNSLGYSDMEWPLKKKQGERRILALGDSFTEGDGAPYDSSYVTLLYERMAPMDSTAYVMNAGICGSDPFINFVNYRDRLAGYQPDKIVQTLSSGDMNTDIIIRGGMERFKSGNKVQYVNPPVWEPLYALSNISRLFFSAIGYNQLLIKDKTIAENKSRLDSMTVDLFKQYAELAKRNNCKLVVILQPYLYEVQNQKYGYDFAQIIDGLKNTDNIRVYDLIPYYRSYVAAHNTKLTDYYWPVDGHHNGAGYKMMADGVYSFITEQ